MKSFFFVLMSIKIIIKNEKFTRLIVLCCTDGQLYEDLLFLCAVLFNVSSLVLPEGGSIFGP